MTNILKSVKVTLCLGSVLLLMILGISNAQEPPLVKVKVYQENLSDGKVRYNYRVINNSERAVVAVRIGYDYYHAQPELSVLPLGWDFYKGLSQGTTTSPSGWQAMLITQEESDVHWLEWSTDENVATWDILPGQTLSGLSVILPNADNNYRTGHFDVILGNSTHISAPMEIEVAPPPQTDTIPPVLSVTLTPNKIWPPNHKMVEITATISVHDDRDPNPGVRLVSITCNEQIDAANDISGADFGADDRNFSIRAERTGQRKDGRVYTATYLATDASGNASTATATVTIPHDQRR